ncbi:MAG: DUF4886 domain-containing protein [Clostridia bacterium]|nr:DUF4886 domain-containing protein [Clostridia bacterium]
MKTKLLKILSLISILCLCLTLVTVPTTVSAADDELQVLFVGNSFTRDANKYIRDFADKAGVKISTGALWQGGITLKDHASEYNNYGLRYYKSGRTGEDYEGTFPLTLEKAVKMYDWDVVIFQQASFPSSDYTTFQPYLTEVSNYIKQKLPNAKQMMYETWSYEYNCPNANFASVFQKDQDKMYAAIKDAYSKAAASIGNVDIIPAGAAFQLARDNKLFDAKNGGKSLNVSDGFHANDAGMYLLGATFFSALTGKDVRAVNFQAGNLSGAEMIALKNAAYNANVNYGNIEGVKPSVTTTKKPVATTTKKPVATTKKPQSGTTAKNTQAAVNGTTAAIIGSDDATQAPTDAPVADVTTQAGEQIQGTSGAELVTEPTTAVSGNDEGKELIPDVMPIIFAIAGVALVAGAAVVVLLIIKSKKSK